MARARTTDARAFAVVALLSATVTVSGRGVNATSVPAATQLPRLTQTERWLRDDRGRVVMLRGGNVIALAGDAGAADVRPEHLWKTDTPARMREAGFNGVRLVPNLANSSQIGLASQVSLGSMQPYLSELTDQKLAEINAALEAIPPAP